MFVLAAMMLGQNSYRSTQNSNLDKALTYLDSTDKTDGRVRQCHSGQVSLLGFCLVDRFFLGRPRGRIVDSRFILRASDSVHPLSP